MISRLRNGGRFVAGLATVMATALDKDDVLTLIGLALLSGGLWLLSHAAALIVPGAILLWMFLPTRPPFVSSATRTRRSAE